jgi:hypothetical protein
MVIAGGGGPLWQNRPAMRRWAPVIAMVAAGLVAADGVRVGAVSLRSPVQRALAFLFWRQVAQPIDVTIAGTRIRDYPGNWPQHFHLRGGGGVNVRDVSPFMAAFVHHALAHVTEAHRASLGLDRVDVEIARVMRKRAVAFMKRFESPPGAPDAGTFAFWPYDDDPDTPDPFLSLVLTAWLRGPILGGARVPLNLPVFPAPLAIPSDADVTSTTYAALLDDAVLDGGTGTFVRFERFFSDWRDRGIVARRSNPSWLPPASGAFLTWLTYRSQAFPLFPNDVDLVVNGNVLYALARYGRLGVRGAGEAVQLINLAASLGLHNDHADEISGYYPHNLAFQYVVSRAFHEGPVPALAPAVRIMADDLEASVRFRADGTAYWDLGDPHLNTAFAILTLLNAGRNTPIVSRAIDYLAAEQNLVGGFDDATFFFGRTDGGQTFEFTSPSFTTAMALEAFVRYRKAVGSAAGLEQDRSASAR